MLGELRRLVATWRLSESKATGVRGSIRAAFLWGVTERWCARAEAFAAQVETDLAQLRSAEQAAQVAYQQHGLRQAPAPLPAPTKSWWRR